MFDMKSLTNSVEQESYLILSKIYISIHETQDFSGNLLDLAIFIWNTNELSFLAFLYSLFSNIKSQM